ncbi:agroclavine dehydrogenase [Penicillium macrosclerotiorum]|uniref:agroclavine dehydrogenase n=1 Tax=Penicillium macrosclerotiorum TaxID=303699 RepID=UPI0025469D03|nr:agroclavine dehydrogenase [Penicillium macrosclerotiorum]KAJ5690901.1 agroclavine dehydrogenase [Penicillium macrosclerotiorum]
MTILVLGGRGKTSIRLAHLLDSSRIPFIIASRTFSLACPYKQAHFDWEDENTYGNPFNQALASQLDPVSAVYIVPSYNIDNMSLIINFIDLARTKGVKRMVLMSASVLENGGQYMGQVHAYLESLQGYLDWTVLRPTWFMGTFKYYSSLSLSSVSPLFS